MKKILFLLLLFLISCEPAYTQISFERIISLRNSFYESESYSAIDSSSFVLNEVHFTYASGWESSTHYLNQKFDIRYYPESSTAVPLGEKIGTLKTFAAFPLEGFVSFLDTNYYETISQIGTDINLLQIYYDDFTNINVSSLDTFAVYLNHENTWWSGSDGPRTLFYNSEFLSFVPLHSTYNDSLNENLKQIFLGNFEIEIQNENTLDNWFDYFNQHKYDAL